MSAPLELDAAALRHIAAALDTLTKLAHEHSIYVGSSLSITYSPDGPYDVELSVRYDVDDVCQIEDRVGS